jgi:hypothetical protein
LDVGFERYEDKGEKSALKFISSSTYYKEEATIKPNKTHYPFNPKPSFNPKREVKQKNPKPRDESFVCMFCGHAGRLNEFCFCCKRIENRRFDYARNSYRDEFIDVPPRSYSHASPHTFSRVLPQFYHGLNHRSYGFGSRESRFMPRRFGYGPRLYRGDRFPHRPGFSAGASHTHFEPRHLHGPCFSHHGSYHSGPNGEVQRIVKTKLAKSSSLTSSLSYRSFNVVIRIVGSVAILSVILNMIRI